MRVALGCGVSAYDKILVETVMDGDIVSACQSGVAEGTPVDRQGQPVTGIVDPGHCMQEIAPRAIAEARLQGKKIIHTRMTLDEDFDIRPETDDVVDCRDKRRVLQQRTPIDHLLMNHNKLADAKRNVIVLQIVVEQNIMDVRPEPRQSPEHPGGAGRMGTVHVHLCLWGGRQQVSEKARYHDIVPDPAGNADGDRGVAAGKLCR